MENVSIRKSLSIYTGTAFTIVSALFHYIMYRVSFQFEEVFEGFGAELPLLTQILLHPAYYWSIPALVGIAFIVHRSGHLTRIQITLFGSILTLGSIALCIIGFYLPIFQLGSVVAG